MAMETMDSLEQLLLHELKDVYGAEKQFLRSAQKISKKVSSPELRKAMETHMRETEGQIRRLEQVFELLDEKPKSVKCKGMAGILEEGEELLKQKGTPETLDAGIIGAAQKVEHYEISTYGTLATWAEMLGLKDVKRLLGQSLDEEEKADAKLTMLAKSGINQTSADKMREAA